MGLKPENKALVERVLGSGPARSYSGSTSIDMLLDAAREEGRRASPEGGAEPMPVPWEPNSVALSIAELEAWDKAGLPLDEIKDWVRFGESVSCVLGQLKWMRAMATKRSADTGAVSLREGSVSVPRALLEPLAELAAWYSPQEEDTFEVWRDYPHGQAPRGILQLGRFRKIAEALASAAPKAGERSDIPARAMEQMREGLAALPAWREFIADMSNYRVEMNNRVIALTACGDHAGHLTSLIANALQYLPVLLAQPQPEARLDREAVARLAALAGLATTNGSYRGMPENWGDEEQWKARVLECIPVEALNRCYELADDILALSPVPVRDETEELRAEVARLTGLLNSPETGDFLKGVSLEIPHQRERWGAQHDAGKGPLDWVWLLGYLVNKAAKAALDGDTEKALHHTISSAAACGNWHAAIAGHDTSMRPGIDPVERGIESPAAPVAGTQTATLAKGEG